MNITYHINILIFHFIHIYVYIHKHTQNVLYTLYKTNTYVNSQLFFEFNSIELNSIFGYEGIKNFFLDRNYKLLKEIPILKEIKCFSTKNSFM